MGPLSGKLEKCYPSRLHFHSLHSIVEDVGEREAVLAEPLGIEPVLCSAGNDGHYAPKTFRLRAAAEALGRELE